MDSDFVKPLQSHDMDLEPSVQDGPKTPSNANPVNKQLSQTPRLIESVLEPPIDNTNRNFNGQQKNETVLCFSRKHWIVLLPHFIMFVIFLILVISFVAVSGEVIGPTTNPVLYRSFALILIAAATYYLHRFFIRLLNYYLQIIIITNFRVIQLDRTLFFQRNMDSIDLSQIQDIIFERHGILKTILNYGEIVITLSSAYASKTIHYMPNPEYHFRKINKTKREYIIARGLAKIPASEAPAGREVP